MSGGLETAAGAFAVVGVADLAIRTGHKVYGFLCNVKDAPAEICKLCELIKETTSLAETSKRCLDRLSRLGSPATSYGATNSLEASLSALNRELQSLSILISRFTGTTKTWGRIKYALDERKTGKALERIERSKLLLGDALVVACR